MKRTLMAAALVALTASGAQAEKFTLQSAFGALPVLNPAAERFVGNISTLTGGEVEFDYLLAGELSPPFEIFDNVSAGAIDAAWSYAAYASGKEPAAALFGSVPFGGDPLSYVSWLHHGGGLELWQELYEPYNLVPMACGVILSEAGGWYTKPIESPEDLQGLNIRIGGLGGAILAKLGANAMSLPAGEISTSLETGRLDATELSFPLVDKLLGFDKVAKHYYFPGWHQPAGFIEFYMNKDKWDGLTDAQRTAIEVSCADANLYAMGVAAGAQSPILEEFRANGVEIKRFPDSVMDALRAAADEVYAEKSAENEMFRKVIDSYRAFAANYNEYQNLSDLN
ncbi:MAG: TRAP transporter substrate-binding protein [Roseibium album]|uniref:Extracytoplasmic solute receptor protein YiaO n=1 Tax=Roseibium album TaxID=311410 RepID=A0A0M6Z5S4_9HYPH|nr:TRAP transporter substrate-binding protein [Roseibium album]MBG6165353.1 TRAP-type mannitol/chloroaromatic compound transport system substrate-binding protein [Labrenzia sp. EL_195]MBG6177419.1 TRAP-type mannitol/chloroaromatic compound transport system substrate-binding protein [Labrenzia sp. EL_132]MBG6232040.1 TRAP-type mannitol/chloroaromatic compound transport system substrate-binding protein [Labrenzia sp. EL_208]CTQ57757.1 Extracytoplasmic solute receptor protein YiaO [Roseibium album